MNNSFNQLPPDVLLAQWILRKHEDLTLRWLNVIFLDLIQQSGLESIVSLAATAQSIILPLWQLQACE